MQTVQLYQPEDMKEVICSEDHPVEGGGLLRSRIHMGMAPNKTFLAMKLFLRSHDGWRGLLNVFHGSLCQTEVLF